MIRALVGGVLVPVDEVLPMIPLRGRGRPRPMGPYDLVGDPARADDDESMDDDVREGVDPETDETRCSSLSRTGVGPCTVGEGNVDSSTGMSIGTSIGVANDRLVSLTSL